MNAFANHISPEFITCSYFMYFMYISGDNQFGFKKHLAAATLFFCVRKTTERFIEAGYTANYFLLICQKHLTRLTTAVCFLKLMSRRLPVELLQCLENLLCVCQMA